MGSGRGIFNVLYRYFPEGTDEYEKTLSQNSRSPDRGLNQGSPEYENGVLFIQPQHLLKFLKMALEHG